MNLSVVVAAGAFGAYEGESPLDSMLRRIALAIPHRPGAWVEKYGADFENSVCMMHPFCYCEREDCPWCCGCHCPSSAVHYFVDGAEVDFAEWTDFFHREAGPQPAWGDRAGHAEWMKRAAAANARRSERHDPVCNFCLTGGPAAARGGGPGKPAPNFWYKPGGRPGLKELKVWWYKYIGRDTEASRPATTGELEQIEAECLESLASIRPGGRSW